MHRLIPLPHHQLEVHVRRNASWSITRIALIEQCTPPSTLHLHSWWHYLTYIRITHPHNFATRARGHPHRHTRPALNTMLQTHTPLPLQSLDSPYCSANQTHPPHLEPVSVCNRSCLLFSTSVFKIENSTFRFAKHR